MLAEDEARAALESEIAPVEIVASARYNDLYLFRVLFPSPDEANFDPFFSVDVETGEVSDFSVMHDGDIDEIAAAFAANQDNP